MPTITVKNVPTDLYERLKQSAKANRRSISSEVIVCIERAVRSRKIHPEAILARARKLREKTLAPHTIVSLLRWPRIWMCVWR